MTLSQKCPDTTELRGVMADKALITGVAGQDGTYLAEHLLKIGYEIHGTDTDPARLAKAEELLAQSTGPGKFFPHVVDSASFTDLSDLVRATHPDEVYNLAADTSVEHSFSDPLATAHSVAVGTANLIQAISLNQPETRIFQASTAEMFGNSPGPQNEDTVLAPLSPYACAKVYAHQLAAMHRNCYDMYICSGIMFNHESPRRDVRFVSRKITFGIARILAGDISSINLGNLTAKRDWGHARDYVTAMQLMLQQAEPVDYVIATGTSHSVTEFLEIAFGLVGLEWREHVVVDPDLRRPSDPADLLGDATRARTRLGWEPSIDLAELIHEMLRHDLAAFDLEGKLP
jgi:GDPmannose 4,6-dehydratase